MAQQQSPYEDSQLAADILENVNQHRELGEFCDITLVVGENPPEEIKAHKLVLSSFSRYFEGLLKPNMKEGHQDRIEIKHLNGPILNKIINYAYTGKIDITRENIEDILEAADFLVLDRLCRACHTFLNYNMNPGNCVGVLRCSMLYSAPELRSAATSMILQNFLSVVKGEEFYELPVDVVRDFIRSEYLAMEGFKLRGQEKLVLDTAIQYLKNHQLEESSDAVLLFEHVRLPLLEKEVLKDLEKSELVLKNETVKKLVQSRSTVTARRAMDNTAEAWMRPRLYGFKVMETESYGMPYHFHGVKDFCDEEAGKDSYVQGMTVYVRDWDGRPSIGGVEVLYASGKRTVHGQRMLRGQAHEFTLEDNERIVDVTIRSGWLIDQLGFIVREKRRLIGPFGGHGGSARNIQKPSAKQDGYLQYVSGEIGQSYGGTVLCGLRLHFGYYDY